MKKGLVHGNDYRSNVSKFTLFSEFCKWKQVSLQRLSNILPFEAEDSAGLMNQPSLLFSKSGQSNMNSELIKPTFVRVGTNQTFPDSIWRKLKWFYSTNIDNVTIELATFRWHPTMKRLVIADKWNYVPGWLGHFINENAGRKSCCETRQLAGSFRTLEMAFKSKHEHTSKEKDSI